MIYTLTYESVESSEMMHEDMTELLEKPVQTLREIIYYMGDFVQFKEI